MQRIVDAILVGKTRGYSCEEVVNSENMFSQYAIKKNEASFICYIFKIPVAKMILLEDVEVCQSIFNFESLDAAISCVEANGGNFEKFGVFGGVKPI